MLNSGLIVSLLFPPSAPLPELSASDDSSLSDGLLLEEGEMQFGDLVKTVGGLQSFVVKTHRGGTGRLRGTSKRSL